jgi:predicted nucleotidyltransferase
VERAATTAVSPQMRAEIVRVLRAHGVVFAFFHGSRSAGGARRDSDIDVAACCDGSIDSLGVRADLPSAADLLVLDGAPLELAGRVALYGELLLDDDPPVRVAWQAQVRKIYLDERPRVDTARRDFVRAFGHG